MRPWRTIHPGTVVFAVLAVIIAYVIAQLFGHDLAVLFGAGGLSHATFIGQAKKRNQILGSIPNDQGTLTPRRLDLRNSGYIQRLRLAQAYDFQFATASPASADAFAQAGGQMSRITIQSNSVGMLYDVSGEMAKAISAIDDGQRLGFGAFDPAPNTFTVAPAQLSTTNVWAVDVPIALQFNNKPWPIGLYQTALNALEVTLEVKFRPLLATALTPGSGLYVPGSATIGTNVRGDLQVQQIYFDPIADPASQPTLAFIHQWREFQTPLTGDGPLDIRLPPSNLYMRMLYWTVFAGVPTITPLQELQLRYGANFAPFDENMTNQFANGAGITQVTRGLQVSARMNRTSSNLFGLATAGAYAGLFWHDFFGEADNEQDFINSAATTDLRSTLTFLGGTYTNPSYLKLAVEQLIPLVVPAAGTGNVQGVTS